MITISHRTGPYYQEVGGNYNIIEAYEADLLISELYADIKTGQIMAVFTIEERRCEGIATSLLDYAEELGIELYHSPEDHCSEDGLAFSSENSQLEIISPELAFDPG